MWAGVENVVTELVCSERKRVCGLSVLNLTQKLDHWRDHNALQRKPVVLKTRQKLLEEVLGTKLRRNMQSSTHCAHSLYCRFACTKVPLPRTTEHHLSHVSITHANEETAASQEPTRKHHKNHQHSWIISLMEYRKKHLQWWLRHTAGAQPFSGSD
jgi:hypothetical protein